MCNTTGISAVAKDDTKKIKKTEENTGSFSYHHTLSIL